jgi:aminomethyltransferase
VRAHATLYADKTGKSPIGEVTSGGFGPSVDGPVAMGYVSSQHATLGTRLYAEVRGKFLPVSVANLPFVTSTYKR